MKLYSVYQPIVQLSNPSINSIVGYESLLRGPKPPLKLFEKATLMGKLLNLDATARELALSGFNGEGKLFINVHPKSLEEGFKIDYTHYNIEPQNIVIEITEHEQLKGTAFKNNIENLKSLGIKIALDDFGNGFTNLKLIEILQPNYIKLDQSLIENVNGAAVRSLLKCLKGLSDDIGAEIIAEGIETEEQKKFVIDCGIKYGQGWLLGKPLQFSQKEAIND